MAGQLPTGGNKKNRIRYGYINLIACFFLMVIVWGAQSCFGVLFKPMISDFGWTRAATSGPYSLYLLIYGILSILAGRLSDRFGSRLVVTCGGIILGIGYILASRISNLGQLYLFYGVIVAAGSSTMYVPIVSIITRWFPRKAGLMSGIGISGIGFGIGVVPIIVSRIVVIFNWRTALFAIGAISLAVITVLAQLLRQPDEAVTTFENNNVQPSISGGFSFTEAIQTRQLWMFSVAWFCYGFFYQVGLVHIVPYATDIGLSATAAAFILTVIGLVGTPGRVGLGIAGDRFTNRLTFAVSFALLGIAYLGLTASSSMAMLYVFGVIYGALSGVGILLAPIIAEYFGYKALGAIVGAVVFANNLGSAISPTLAGKIFDITGSYQLAFLSCGIFGIVAAVILWRLERPSKDIL